MYTDDTGSASHLITAVWFQDGGGTIPTNVGAAPEYQNIEGGNRNNSPNCYSYAIGIYDKSHDPGDFSEK